MAHCKLTSYPMRTGKITNRRAAISRWVVTLSLLAIATAGHAGESNWPTVAGPPAMALLASVNPAQYSLGAAPRVSTLATPRTIFAGGCTGPLTLDARLSTPTRLVLRVNPSITFCASPPAQYAYTPAQTGVVQVQMLLPDESIAASVELESVAGARSPFNLDGMWFDPETNGAGISIYHAAASDAVFGTWFMFSATAGGGTRWFSLQSLKWIFDGRSLVGAVYQTNASGQPLCTAGDDCPRKASAVSVAGSIAILVIDQNNLQIDAFSPFGQPVFSSRVRRLAL